MFTIEEGEKPVPRDKNVLVYLNPYDPSQILICDTDRTVLGLCHRAKLGNRTQLDLLERQHQLRQRDRNTYARGAKKFDDLKAIEHAIDHAHNEAILNRENPAFIDVETREFDPQPTPRNSSADIADIAPRTPTPETDDPDDDDIVTDLL